MRGYPEILTTKLLEQLEAYQEELPTLGLPEPVNTKIAVRLRATHQLAWRIDEARRFSHYVADCGDMPPVVRNRVQTKRPA